MKDDQKFELGAIVCLKSGGQKMTVEHFGPVSYIDNAPFGENVYHCLWSIGGESRRDTFKECVLRLASPVE